MSLDEIISMLESLWESVEVSQVGSLTLFKQGEPVRFGDDYLRGAYLPILHDDFRGFRVLPSTLKFQTKMSSAQDWKQLSQKIRRVGEQYEFFERALKDKRLVVEKGHPFFVLNEESVRVLKSLLKANVWVRKGATDRLSTSFDLYQMIEDILSSIEATQKPVYGVTLRVESHQLVVKISYRWTDKTETLEYDL